MQLDITDPQTVDGTAITGDTPYTAFNKVNLSMLYLGLLASNNLTALATVSNTGDGFAPTLAFQGLEIFTNTLLVTWCQHELLSLANNPIANGTVNSNALDGPTLAWLQSCLVPGVAMNFDGGQITSDGLGDVTCVGLYAQQWEDLGGNT